MRKRSLLGRPLATAALTTALAALFFGAVSPASATTTVTPAGTTSFGIDISRWQNGIDLPQAKRDGVQFVIVKASGFNVKETDGGPYKAGGYREHVNAARAASLPVGHYYIPGRGQTPAQQADFFVNNLHDFKSDRDVLALDNEVLDDNGTLWTDADAAAFMSRVIERTGISAKRAWFYVGASDARDNAPWSQVIALGARIWWAAWGDAPTGQTPDHEPQLRGAFPGWDIHQFTNRTRVAGRNVDGNYSRHSITELFGS